MNRLNIFLVLLVVGLLNAFSVQASFACIGAPPVSTVIKSGQSCGGIIPCEAGNYCDITSTCVANKVAGDSCIRPEDCPLGTQCVGSSATNKKCQTNANPGETCSDTNGPKCGTGLNCNSGTNKCDQGRAGDGCKNDADCQTFLKCSNKVCKPTAAVGDDCASNAECGFGRYCKNLKCAAGKTSGECTSGDECATGYSCLPNSFKSDAKSSCLKTSGVADGEWCYENSEVCASGICHRGHCIGKSPVSCSYVFSCVVGETCTCDGGYIIGGNGVCKEDKCKPLFFAFSDCVALNCPSLNIDFTQSCANNLCADALKAYTDCDPQQVLINFLAPA